MGKSDPYEMLRSMPAALIDDWLNYFSLVPDTGYRVDVAGAQIVATLANIYKRKGAGIRKVTEFIPKWDGPPSKEEKIKSMIATVEALNKQMGGQDLRKK